MQAIAVTINSESYKVKQSFRSLLEFEKRTGRSVYEANPDLTDSLIFFYCALLTSNPGTFTMTQDELLDYLDNDPTPFQKFRDFVLSQAGVETATADKKKVEKR